MYSVASFSGTRATPVLPDSGHAFSSVAVLMAMYQGAAFVKAQLDSIAAQGDGWRLVVSDDGSTDGGPDIARAFARCHPGQVQLIDGPRQGAAANFRALLQQVPNDIRFAALVDQDDVWRPGRLARAIGQLSAVHPARPAIYCSRVSICDRRLRRIGGSRPVFPPSFAHALVQNLVQGGTAVLNRAAIDLVQQAGPLTPAVVMHDWWLYQLVTGAGGRILHDAEETVLYRQHDDNLIGAHCRVRDQAASLARMLTGIQKGWSAQTIAALTPVRHLLTEENRRLLDEFAALHRGALPRRLLAMRRGGFRRQTALSQAALWAAAALGRI